MEAKDLRIGNYFIYNTDGCFHNNPERESKTISVVRQIKEDSVGITHLKTTGILIGGLGLIKPIPLTEEWLVKFGFECIEKDVPCLRDRTMSRFFLNNFNIEILSDGQIYQKHFESTELINCDYTHQLQNLYFALTGEELTIKK